MQVGTYPTRNFALVSPHVAMRLGPYLHLEIGLEMAGVWPLRIPRSELNKPDLHRSASWPFLLIVRTGRIFTAGAIADEYRRIHGVSSI